MKKKILYLIVLSFFLNSCLKKELAVSPSNPGEITTVQIEIGYPYLHQVYYDCETNSIVASNTKYDWDLSFECTADGFHILLNTAKGIFIANQGNIPFSTATSVANATWLWDAPSGNLDSTAIADWRNTNNVYIIDRQFDINGNHIGYKKIQFIDSDDQTFTFKYADLNGDNEITHTITKDNTRNFIHFNFDNGGQTLLLEPEKNSWDLLFSNHYHKFSNLTMPFILTQCLTNKYNGVLVAEDNNNNFFNISLADTSIYNYSDDWDEIGYDWKILNSQDNSFTIDPNKSFILKTTNDIYYKIRFIDFYNDQGMKGYPTFEIQKL